MEIIVPCPECGYHLHLPSRDLLGRKGKCPTCSHKFVMEESAAMSSPVLPTDDTQVSIPEKPKAKPKPKATKTPAIEKPSPKPKKGEGRKTVEGIDQTVVQDEPLVPPKDLELTEPKAKPPADAAPPPSKIPPDEPEEPSDADDEVDWDSLGDEETIGPGESVTCTFCHRQVPFQNEDDLHDLQCPHCQKSMCLVHPETPASALKIPSKVGNFRLEKSDRIGLGPFGTVYRAKDGESDPQREVAVKISHGDQFSPEELDRFLANFAHAVQLKHANMVKIRLADQVDNRVYWVSDYIAGRDLTEYLTGSEDLHLKVRQAASLCALVAGALQQAHRYGVVHGNLKPSNIRVDANLTPFLLDFGLHDRPKAIQLTGNGRIVGNAAYLAPEQVAANQSPLTPQTDIFSLGVILYELITGQRPFKGEGKKLLQQIAKASPKDPRSLNSEIPKPLAIICLMCLQADPRDRYQSASELNKDLRAYLQDNPISAKPPGLISKLGRWARRRPIMIGLLLTFFLLAAFGAGFVGWRMWQIAAIS